MYIVLPLDSDDTQEAKLTKIEDAKVWGQILIENGEVVEINFAKNWDEFENFSQAVVVCDDGEYVWPFMELNMMVLVAHIQRYIDDIVEAYLFKELHELAY